MYNLLTAAEDDNWVGGSNMLVTVLVILAIIALIIWIVRRD